MSVAVYEPEPPSNVIRLHRDCLDAAYGWHHADTATRMHATCEVGVCACLTVATIKIRSLRRRW